jgi:hypothetical protein
VQRDRADQREDREAWDANLEKAALKNCLQNLDEGQRPRSVAGPARDGAWVFCLPSLAFWYARENGDADAFGADTLVPSGEVVGLFLLGLLTPGYKHAP